MPKNNFSDPITDQEIAFALLVLSGTMTDQRAAKAVGLNPHNAAYIQSKPCVRAFMDEHRARVQQQLVEQETEGLRRLNPSREQVLDRLWELANMSSEMTRGSITGQVKAISMIVAIEGLIPDRRVGSAQRNPDPPPTKAQIYTPPRRRRQQEEAAGPRQEDGPGDTLAEPAPGSAADAPGSSSEPGPAVDPGEPAVADHFNFSETPSAPYAPFVPDTRFPFSIDKNRFGNKNRFGRRR
jgi:hypothetical protein